MTAKERAQLTDDQFALPQERKYPIEDRAHAANAKARATQMAKRGTISAATIEKIDRAANLVLKGHGDGKDHWSGH